MNFDSSEGPRIGINSFQCKLGIDYAELVAEQQREGITPQGAPNLATLPFGDNIQVVCDGSTGVIRPVVPVNLQRKIFGTLYDLAHPGTKASVHRIMKRFAWDGLQQDFR